ncbi:oligoendopeptidase F family protein [Mangrovimicrobium sediminis]|uniref:Oligoendopeptidase F family protein n=1 Tax=Mangrovimicrobium sediminis TaxID=2562682 RepID=A0A4Z0M3T7_9GAMM|nr:M3 family oligoendopeptidase [Haliea sp. SAOS-164]TGD74171.1 oligoendopeptidase F family protein [Haliea sp. SAOS-164]
MKLQSTVRRALGVAAVAVALPLAPFAAAEELYFDSRDAMPEQYTWDLGLYFADAAAWDAAYAAVEARLGEAEQYRGKVGSSAKTMAAALQTQFDLYHALFPLYVHAHQKVHVNNGDTQGNEQSGRSEALYARMQSALAFIEPEIAQVPEKQAKKYRKAKELQPYLHYLDNIWRLREHTRSPEVEEVVAGSSLPGSGHVNAYNALNHAGIEWPTVKDENGEDAVVSPGQFGRLRSSPDRQVRENAYQAHLAAIARYRDTFAATMGSKIQRDVWLARVYHYPSAVAAALSASNVPPEVLETLLDTVHSNTDKLQGYLDLRRRILGYETLYPWDTSVPLITEGGRSYTFPEAWELAMQFWTETFGEEFATIAQEALDKRWVDVYSNEGKQGGAYSWGTYQQPYYLFLNWEGNFDSLSTLVHEMGHSVHGVLADRNQSFHNADPATFVAEVGSVASESLFTEWMLERTTDPVERKLLLDHSLSSIRNTFVTQIFFHEWEARAHALAEAGEALTADTLGNIYVELNDLYNGDAIAQNEYTNVYWARIPHFFRNFYVWNYATSFAAGEALAARFRSGDKSAAADYIKMLKLGGSVYPLDALKVGGVDMTDPAVIQSVMDRFGALQVQLAKEFELED